MIVDTHTHVIARDEVRYPLRPSGVGSNWYRESPCTAEELTLLMEGAGVGAAVLVQAFGAYTYDNSYVVDAAAVSPGRFTSVVIVDPEAPGATDELRALAQAGATGVRLFSIGPADRPQPTWLDAPATFAVWEASAALGLRVVVACLPEHLSRLGAMLARFPEQVVLLDHLAFVDAADPDDTRALFELARHPRLYGKVTSHALQAAPDPGELVHRLVAEFGADRLVWGSDFPQTHDRPYGALVALAETACADLAARDRDLVLGGTALRVWPELA